MRRLYKKKFHYYDKLTFIIQTLKCLTLHSKKSGLISAKEERGPADIRRLSNGQIYIIDPLLNPVELSLDNFDSVNRQYNLLFRSRHTYIFSVGRKTNMFFVQLFLETREHSFTLLDAGASFSVKLFPHSLLRIPTCQVPSYLQHWPSPPCILGPSFPLFIPSDTFLGAEHLFLSCYLGENGQMLYNEGFCYITCNWPTREKCFTYFIFFCFRSILTNQ